VDRTRKESLRQILSFKSKVIAGLATALGILLLVAFLSYLDLARNVEDMQWVAHTHAVLEKLNQLYAGMIDAEAAARGYVIVGDDSYLDPFRTGRGNAEERFKEVREMVADNPRQEGNLDRLSPLIQARLSKMEETVRTRTERGLAAGIASVQEGSGKALTDQIQQVIARMKAEEERLLLLRSAEVKNSSRKTREVIVLGEALGLLFLLVAGQLVRQEMRKLAQAEAEVRTLNADLERKVAERTSELAERARELETSNTELQQFAYVASHDLQEPLRTISSFTQLLAKRYQDKLDDKAREFINFAVEGCKRMQALINDLLAFSRVGTHGKEHVAVQCDAALDRVLRGLKIAIEESGAVITRDPLPAVTGDEIQLCQLFQNLVGNAIKFRNKDVPKIHISAVRNGTGWKISFRDNGIGIASEHSDRIFVIFQRLHTKMQYPGTGIGLAICKKIAERHSGRIWFEPSPGGGSTFYVTIGDRETDKTREREGHEFRISTTAN
jgi:signal transduction histidine kinase